MEPKTQDTAERRQVTVMFSDLVGGIAGIHTVPVIVPINFDGLHQKWQAR
jgi:hypothetical protein